MIGLGPRDFELGIYIANRPDIDHYPGLSQMQAMAPGELAYIVEHTSNHWRKLFNVLAKLMEGLDWTDDWRTYRDTQLLQTGCRCALLFDAPVLEGDTTKTHVVAGKTHAASLGIDADWLDSHFALNQSSRLIVSPYPDYRQLSNVRIDQLARLIVSLSQSQRATVSS